MSSGDKTEEGKKQAFGYLIDSISVDVIISPFYDKQDILKRMKGITKKGYDHPITIYYRNDYKDYIDGMYKEIGEIKPIKPTTT